MDKNGFKGVSGIGVAIVLVIIAAFVVAIVIESGRVSGTDLESFDNCSDIVAAFNESQQQGYGWEYDMVNRGIGVPMMASKAGAAEEVAPDYSTTNIQVEGVDEADIVKTDGNYIYTVSNGKLSIARAYPVADAEVLSITELEGFVPQEIFIHNDYLLIFGRSEEEWPVFKEVGVVSSISRYPYWFSISTLQLWDISDRADPENVRSVDFEGNYLSSRKIGPYVYFVVNSYPRIQHLESVEEVKAEDIVPLVRDSMKGEGVEPSCGCANVKYIEPINPENFVTVAAIKMDDPDSEIVKEVIVGSGSNIYASLENLYIAQSYYPSWRFWILEEGQELDEKTGIHKFSLSNGQIDYLGHMEAPGHILNQFSMDEHEGFFRIATTKGHVSRMVGEASSFNNVYIFNNNLEMVGELEDLAPGERIYSVRFMGDRGYVVSFKKVDPLFVIDLSDPNNPSVLGKLKIPGYSDYLHPFDEDHIIGLGKETVEAEEEGADFAWYQGIKMAIFDVSDVENPKELHNVVIGDRGTDSYALHDHKAFLFDREKELLVIPVLLAEIKDKEDATDWTHGDYVFQGAYVYRISLGEGFELRGRITHVGDEETFKKSGFYYYGAGDSVQRALYIGDVLYTLSRNKIKLNSLADLSELKILVLGEEK